MSVFVLNFFSFFSLNYFFYDFGLFLCNDIKNKFFKKI